MKICIDMQGVQTESRHRGIGRYCLSVTREFAALAESRHTVRLLFNAALDGIDEAIVALGPYAGPDRRGVFGPLRYTASDNPANEARRDAAERVFTHALDVREPDAVWLGSVVEGFTDDALIPHALPGRLTVATLYDLIPLHDPHYAEHSRARDWYMRRLDTLKRCDLLLAISEWVREDAIERLALHPERIVAIGAGVDSRFAPLPDHATLSATLAERHGIVRPFVMYNGGFDKRKNVFALIDAYADLPQALRDTHQLVIVGRIDATLATRFAEAIADRAMANGEVIFTGFVSDDDLVGLYRTCALFVFPSQSEGFGLPALEAMACGAATIANDATSLPEVVGTAEALFDANVPGAMSEKIRAVLTRPDLAQRLRVHGLARAAHFSWRAVAERALTAIEARAPITHRRASPDQEATQPIVVIGDVAQAAAHATNTPVPVYRVDADNLSAMWPWIRRWPGCVLFDAARSTSVPMDATDRYRLGGYARIDAPLREQDWPELLRREAVDVRLLGADRVIDVADTAAWIDQVKRTRPLAGQRVVEDDLGDRVAARLTDDEIAVVSDAIERLRPRDDRRWLVDVTSIATNDLGTGVHRVVRSILVRWLTDPPAGIRIEPIAFREGRYEYAHDYACALSGITSVPALPNDLVSVLGNETFVGLDWAMESIPASASLLRTWRRAGVAMHFIVNDLLPITLPEAFHPHSRKTFLSWLETIAGLADALHCISRATASDLDQWLETRGQVRRPVIATFRLGVDIPTAGPAVTLTDPLACAMATRPSLLMVGTLEPRKGHRQALDAAEVLWEAGQDINLVIVGKQGWLVRDLIDRLRRHGELGKRLFWLEKADDATLEALYAASTALLAPSLGEGFGLPLIEAAHRGKPVIARQMAVFREVAGDYPSYFDSDSAEGLATHLARWLVDRPAPGAHPAWATWAESAHSLTETILSSGGGGAATL